MNTTHIESLKQIAGTLSQSEVKEYGYIPRPAQSSPNVNRIKEMMSLLKSIFFPDFFDDAEISAYTQESHIDVYLERLYSLLNELLCQSERTLTFIGRLPEIKRLLATDVKAMHDSDPAATSYSEVILCYPAIQAMVHYRVAHELLRMDVPVLPRIITELAHSATGIDIHPGARIGEYFSIDHGTGVVIGETCVIGNHVRLYQGVTLGAKGFTFDHEGLPLNEPRHPIIEDHVIIYSNSTILGRITIGHHAVIGGNIWQVYAVPPYSRIIQKKATSSFTDGLGI
ncbi:MAG: serine acetyltransferase [Prevotellaceae bacterium]|jgi:serine O-acetyltransferase|nr:serine acetyltransferase [Prevotellaceae bacterium]